MSKTGMNEFGAVASRDEEMARGLIAAVDGKSGAAAAAAFAAYAQSRGFEVTAEEVEGWQRAAEGEGTLSDDQLDTVSGAGIFDLLIDLTNAKVKQMMEQMHSPLALPNGISVTDTVVSKPNS